MNTFEELKLTEHLANAIKKLGFTEPTQIQAESIPPIMEGKDVIGESATGSGKTLAFGCGIIEKTVPGKGLQALVLTPTRELAEQVKDSLHEISFGKKLRIVAVYGGVSINPQIDTMHGADVVVGTPGRLLDHLERRTIDLSHVKILVLDEADRMLDMGFIDDVELIIKQCSKERQTMFFSATIAPRIRELADRYMHNPVEVFATKMVDPTKLTQVYYDVPRNMKMSLLIHLLEHEEAGLVMVFCNTRRITDFVVKNLRANKIDAIAIHGGLTQNKRTKTISMFNNGKVNVLVCTDVAARGLHIDNVSHVYNYDIPGDGTDYVHRIGRTARAGEEGKVINLLCEFDHENFNRVIMENRDLKIPRVERPHVKMVAARRVEDSRRDDPRMGNSRRGPPRRMSAPARRW
ncbi:DEAD/DEAH box helicase [Candidatus Woesearchaeota archaeon]|nr:DEAD/DEAH box helicase [Candidatus Woesearchaeota archaeon]HIH46702.1 DEAD/DEAH box helicase [Candidatus Woesearchaeota archaeon]